MFCSLPMLLWWVSRRILVIWLEVKFSLVLYRNIWGGACNSAMDLGACANSSVRLGCCLLTMILRERTGCIFMRLVYLGVQCFFYVRIINPWWRQFS